MDFKKMLATIVAGASLLTMAGAASAVSGDINIYGASAQFNFWKAQAPNFLGSSQGGSCTGIANASLDAKNAITKATCGSSTVYFRTSSKASYDGPLAIQGNTTNPNRDTTCSDPTKRPMVDESTCNWTTGVCTGTKCVPVTGGASDVQVTSFVQESHGLLKGPNGGAQTDRNFKGVNGFTSDGLGSDCRALIVPFAFYVNKNVKASGTTITNLTEAEIRLIFSGQIYDWSDLGYDPQAITVCMRHAGSGTHAALDFDVMRPAGLMITADPSNGFYFNDGASDLMNCVNGAGGGVGYADADQSLATYGNTAQVTFNGYAANKANITTGKYDFYTTQNLYTVTPVPTDMATLCAFMKKPANNTNAYYANTCEMQFLRSDDRGYSLLNSEFGNCP